MHSNSGQTVMIVCWIVSALWRKGYLKFKLTLKVPMTFPVVCDLLDKDNV